MARCKAGALSESPSRGLFVRTPRHLRAQGPARDADCSLVLPCESHTTFSLLPDCLAARFPGELDEVEAVVAHAEQAPSLAAAANALRRDAVELPGAMRWVERRVRLVHHVLTIVIGLLPEPLARCVAEMGAVRTRLETETALRALRTLVAEQLPVLPAPLGFRPHRLGTTNRNQASPTQDGA